MFIFQTVFVQLKLVTLSLRDVNKREEQREAKMGQLTTARRMVSLFLREKKGEAGLLSFSMVD